VYKDLCFIFHIEFLSNCFILYLENNVILSINNNQNFGDLNKNDNELEQMKGVKRVTRFLPLENKKVKLFKSI
jgi:hypothetical protein